MGSLEGPHVPFRMPRAGPQGGRSPRARTTHVPVALVVPTPATGTHTCPALAQPPQGISPRAPAPRPGAGLLGLTTTHVPCRGAALAGERLIPSLRPAHKTPPSCDNQTCDTGHTSPGRGQKHPPPSTCDPASPRAPPPRTRLGGTVRAAATHTLAVRPPSTRPAARPQGPCRWHPAQGAGWGAGRLVFPAGAWLMEEASVDLIFS